MFAPSRRSPQVECTRHSTILWDSAGSCWTHRKRPFSAFRLVILHLPGSPRQYQIRPIHRLSVSEKADRQKVIALVSIDIDSSSHNSSAPTAHCEFTPLSLAKPLLDALRAEGYTTPTPIQTQAIPPALEGNDILGIAQTGTGKTAAFALPILHQMLRAEATQAVRTQGRAPRALILAPTRELAAQIGESFATYGANTKIRHVVIFGGVNQRPQVNALRNGVDIIVATPGRLTDLMQQRLVDLSAISFAVLDEADRLLDMGFIEPIRRIMKAIPQKRQTMLFSATMPQEIKHLADSFLKNPTRVAVTPVASTVDRIEQQLYQVPSTQKLQLLLHVLRTPGVGRVLVFTKTKHGADRVVKRLASAGVTAGAIHGNKAQNHRTRTLEAFRSGSSPVLVATDIAARGIDVDGITHVVNFDLPMEPEAYVHRIGRTARAGASGIAITFCSPEERGLLRSVEKLTRKQIPGVALPTELPPMPAAQQHGHAGNAHAGNAPHAGGGGRGPGKGPGGGGGPGGGSHAKSFHGSHRGQRSAGKSSARRTGHR